MLTMRHYRDDMQQPKFSPTHHPTAVRKVHNSCQLQWPAITKLGVLATEHTPVPTAWLTMLLQTQLWDFFHIFSVFCNDKGFIPSKNNTKVLNWNSCTAVTVRVLCRDTSSWGLKGSSWIQASGLTRHPQAHLHAGPYAGFRCNSNSLG